MNLSRHPVNRILEPDAEREPMVVRCTHLSATVSMPVSPQLGEMVIDEACLITPLLNISQHHAFSARVGAPQSANAKASSLHAVSST